MSHSKSKAKVDPGQVVVNLPELEAIIAQLMAVKTGWKTSEFWVTLVVDIASFIGGVFPTGSIAVRVASAAVAVVTTVGYILARAQVKKAAAQAAGQVAADTSFSVTH